MEFRKILLPYQIEAYSALEKYKYSILMWSRQTGKSFVISLWATFRALEKKNHTILIISPTERQSKNLMNKVKMHIKALKLISESEVSFDEFKVFIDDTELTVLETRFPNGTTIVGLPANPDGVRGYSGDVIMEESAFFKDGYGVYQAVFPSITRKKDYKFIVISTPKTKHDIFGHLWQMSQDNPRWYRQKLTIYDAVNKGLDIDIEELKEGVPTEDIWKQEYLCEFLEEDEYLLPYELIHSCTQENIETNVTKADGEFYLGIDIGRRKDLTVLSFIEKIGSKLILRKLEILKNMPFSKQLQFIENFMPFVKRVAIDETGIGMQIAEELKNKYGSKVIPVYFTNKSKDELATKLKSKFEDRLITIPPDRDLIQDLHSVKKSVTTAGNIKYEAKRTDKGHADRFWSLALAIYASEDYKSKGSISIVNSNIWNSKRLEIQY